MLLSGTYVRIHQVRYKIQQRTRIPVVRVYVYYCNKLPSLVISHSSQHTLLVVLIVLAPQSQSSSHVYTYRVAQSAAARCARSRGYSKQQSFALEPQASSLKLPVRILLVACCHAAPFCCYLSSTSNYNTTTAAAVTRIHPRMFIASVSSSISIE